MTRRTYAQDTSVSIARSRQEIEQLLLGNGADQIVMGVETSGDGIVRFRAHGRYFEIPVKMPDRAESARTPTGLHRYADAVDRAWEQAKRARWRAVALWIKAMFVAIDAGVLTLEEAFLGNTLLPAGVTVGGFLRDQVQQAYDSGEMPSLIPGAHPALQEGNHAAS